MKKTIFTMAVMACMALAISTSYGQEPDKKTEKAKENLQEAKVEVAVAKVDLTEAQTADVQAFMKESEMKIKKNEESITDLKIKILKNSEREIEADQLRVSELEQKNVNLQKDLTDYVFVGQAEWAAFTAKFNYEMDELTKALKDFTILSEK
jgi:methylthioribose-1-phosphate isomerase